MNRDQQVILYTIIVTFVFLQFMGFNIGNRQYSMHYKSHFLIKRTGLAKLIYFKPKHFHRYSIWEVVAFFFSYINLIAFSLVFGLSFKFDQLGKIGAIASLVVLIVSVIYVLIKIIYIDISEHIESKNMPITKSNFEVPKNSKINKNLFNSILSYSQTIRYKLESLYDDRIKRIKNDNVIAIEKLDDEFIQYFKDYKLIEVVKDKVIYSKDKNIKYKIEFSFDSKKRETFPDFKDGCYMPHIVIDGTKEYLGVAFIDADIFEFDKKGTGIIKTLYKIENYKDLTVGTEFTIREGNKIVGKGKIIEII